MVSSHVDTDEARGYTIAYVEAVHAERAYGIVYSRAAVGEE